jgi:hypothetical protein
MLTDIPPFIKQISLVTLTQNIVLAVQNNCGIGEVKAMLSFGTLIQDKP